MDLIHRISQQFEDSARCILDSLEWLAAPIAGSVEVLTGCLLNSGKILVCGNGTASLDAEMFAAKLVNRFEMERPPLTAIALNPHLALRGDHQRDHSAGCGIFAQQVAALGHPGDVLLVLSVDGNDAGVLAAIDAAHDRDMRIIALTAGSGGLLGERLREADIHVCVPAGRPARAQEVHRLALHCLCDGIDCLLLGVEDA